MTPENNKEMPIFQFGRTDCISSERFAFNSARADIEWHAHENGLFGSIESGLFELHTLSGCQVFSPGVLVYIPPHLPHVGKATSDCVCGWSINLPKERTALLPSELTAFQSSELILAFCHKILSWGNFAEETPTQKRLVSAFLDELQNLKQVNQMSAPFPNSEALAAVAKSIMENPGDMRSLDYWAGVSAMSRRSFTRRFKEETGLTFTVWRQRIKIIAALKMLAAKKSNAEIAFALGYKNTSTFNLLFSKQFGLPPAQYMRAKNEATEGKSDR